MVSAVLFSLYDTLIYLTRNRNAYMLLCGKTNCRNRIRESIIVEAATLLDLCSHLEVEPRKTIVWSFVK